MATEQVLTNFQNINSFSNISEPVLRTLKNIYLEHHWCVLSLNLEHQKTIYIEHLLIFRVLTTLKKKNIYLEHLRVLSLNV